MAALSNIYIDQGSDFTTTISLTDSNGDILVLTGYSVLAQIRKTYGSTTIAATFTTALSADSGQLTLSLADTVTTGMDSGRYVYDVLLTDASGDKTRVLEGQAVLTPGVSRS
jgi:hypothetical protein|tara:strand:- start:726 stop:1061 length:336 start_codon:yes stop_codon:yes gene_type:complete